MKLKSDFFIQDIEDKQFLVPMGANTFHGVIRSNRTAAFIVTLLREETTVESIVDAMCARFDVDRETATRDVQNILATLRGVNAIDE